MVGDDPPRPAAVSGLPRSGFETTAVEPGAPVPDTTIKNHALIWSVADLLRGLYKQSKYGKVILPLTVLPDGHPNVR